MIKLSESRVKAVRFAKTGAPEVLVYIPDFKPEYTILALYDAASHRLRFPGRGLSWHETDNAPVQNEKARDLSLLLEPISRHSPIFRQSGFGTARVSKQKPTQVKASNVPWFIELADFCTVGPWLERGLPIKEVGRP